MKLACFVLGVIEILNKVVHTATKTEEQDQEVVVTEENYEGLWVVTPFEESDFWFLKTGITYTFIISVFTNIRQCFIRLFVLLFRSGNRSHRRFRIFRR